MRVREACRRQSACVELRGNCAEERGSEFLSKVGEEHHSNKHYDCNG